MTATPATIAETLTQGERALPFALGGGDDTPPRRPWRAHLEVYDDLGATVERDRDGAVIRVRIATTSIASREIA